jgi:hypothetical protein
MKRSWSEILRFQRGALIVIAIVWAIRLGLSLAGVSDDVARFASISAVGLTAAVLYYPWALWRTGFGAFRELYRLCLVQGVFSQTLVALAIVLAIFTGQDNIFTVPEYYPPSSGGSPLPPDGKNFGHALAHILLAGAIVIPIVTWLLGSLVLLVLRKLAPRPAATS